MELLFVNGEIFYEMVLPQLDECWINESDEKSSPINCLLWEFADIQVCMTDDMGRASENVFVFDNSNSE